MMKRPNISSKKMLEYVVEIICRGIVLIVSQRVVIDIRVMTKVETVETDQLKGDAIEVPLRETDASWIRSSGS